MKYIDSLPLARRLALGFGLVIALALVVAGYGSLQFKRLSDQTELLASDRMVKLDQASTLRANVGTVSRNLRDLILSMDEEVRQAQLKEATAARTENAELMKALEGSEQRGDGMQALAALKSTGDTYQAAIDKVMEFARQSANEQARDTIFKEVAPAQTAYLKALGDMIALQRDRSREAAIDVQSSARWTSLVMLVLAAAATLAGAVVAWRLARAIVAQLGGEPAYASSVAREIAAGNLAVAVSLRPGDTTSLLAGMKDMRDRLAACGGSDDDTLSLIHI